jgi:hypothetical protein
MEIKQEQRISRLRCAIRETKDTVEQLTKFRDDRGTFDKGQLLASGLPPPPLNKMMDWAVDDDEDEEEMLQPDDAQTQG